MEAQNPNQFDREITKAFLILLRLSTFLVVVIFLLFFYILVFTTSKFDFLQSEDKKTEVAVQEKIKPEKQKNEFWEAPDLDLVSDANKKQQLEYGKDLVVNTAKYFGPSGSIAKNAINGMNCQNCHLDAGTKVFGNNYSAVASTYPKYRARSGGVEDITKRINDCFERSLNGQALDTNSKEMLAMVAYINFLGENVPKGEKPKGSGLKEMSFLDRAIDPKKGAEIYTQKCASCHQADGLGTLNEDKTAFIYPPLWGEKSYNDGAGLYRMSNFAKYIKYNMPLGANHESAQLSDEEAWDIAAYVNSQPRPKKDISKDWPKIEEKPFDHPFGPFSDGFSEKEHKFGPFKPIIAKKEALKKSKQTASNK